MSGNARPDGVGRGPAGGVFVKGRERAPSGKPAAGSDKSWRDGKPCNAKMAPGSEDARVFRTPELTPVS